MSGSDQADGTRTAGGGGISAIGRAMDVVARLCTYIAGILLVCIVVINGCNVFMRYVMHSGISWAEESMVFLMIASVFIGAIPITWEKAHIRIDAFVASLHGKVRLAVEALAVLVAAAVLMPVGWLSIGVVAKLFRFDQRSDALDLPVWIPQATVPFALFLIPLVMALALTRGVAGPHEDISHETIARDESK